MPPPKITTSAQLKKYAQEKLQEFDDYVARFMQIYDEIVYNNIDYNRRNRIVELRDKFKNFVGTMGEITPSAIPLWVNKIDNRLAAGILLYREIEEYEQEFGARDRAEIRKITATVQKTDNTFKTVWKPYVAKALADKDPERAAQLVVNLPYFSQNNIGPVFLGVEKLYDKHKRINNWVGKMRHTLPRPAILRAEIIKEARALEEINTKVETALGNFAERTQGLAQLRGEAEQDSVRGEAALEAMRPLEALLEKQRVKLWHCYELKKELAELTAAQEIN